MAKSLILLVPCLTPFLVFLKRHQRLSVLPATSTVFCQPSATRPWLQQTLVILVLLPPDLRVCRLLIHRFEYSALALSKLGVGLGGIEQLERDPATSMTLVMGAFINDRDELVVRRLLVCLEVYEYFR